MFYVPRRQYLLPMTACKVVSASEAGGSDAVYIPVGLPIRPLMHFALHLRCQLRCLCSQPHRELTCVHIIHRSL